MHIARITVVSPINPADGMHHIEAVTREDQNVEIMLSPEAYGALVGYYDHVVGIEADPTPDPKPKKAKPKEKS